MRVSKVGMKTVRLILALHNHQPVGNFRDVFEKACRVAYHPFLDALDEFPEIRFTLHYSARSWSGRSSTRKRWWSG